MKRRYIVSVILIILSMLSFGCSTTPTSPSIEKDNVIAICDGERSKANNGIDYRIYKD